MGVCPRCKGNEVYQREMRAAEGLVLEEWHTCGWSKAKGVLLPGMAKPVKPSTEKDWKPTGFHQPLVSGSAGGRANYAKNGATGAAALNKKKALKAKVPRKPYIRKNPRKVREAMGYHHLGALDTIMLPPRPELIHVDPSS